MQNKKKIFYYSVFIFAQTFHYISITPLFDANAIPPESMKILTASTEKIVEKNLPQVLEAVETTASSMEKVAEIVGKALGSEAAGKALEAVKIMTPVANGAVKIAGVYVGICAVEQVYSMGKDIVSWCNQSPEETARQKLSEANYKRAYEIGEAKGNFTKCLVDTIKSGKTVKMHEGLPCRCENLANIYAALAGKKVLDEYRNY